MHDHLRSILRLLRLSGLAASLDVRIQEAQASRLSHLEFLELIFQDEVAVRDHRRIDRRTKFAGFRDLKTLDQFDWEFNTSLPRRQLFELATCRFLDDARDILLMGPPGTGKTHLAQAIGYAAIKQGRTVLYRSVFDVVRDFLHEEAPQQNLWVQTACSHGLCPEVVKACTSLAVPICRCVCRIASVVLAGSEPATASLKQLAT